MKRNPKLKTIELHEPEILRLYCNLMEEVKIRVVLLNYNLANKEKLPPLVVREHCYLQLRFICEIIAMACVVAHGDVKETHLLHSTYEPKVILKKLEKLNPNFFPYPMHHEKDDCGVHILTGRTDSVHLSKQELLKLWAWSGNVLHRSPMVKIFDPQYTFPQEHQDIVEWIEKIVGLLNSHWITLVENTKALYVNIKTETDGKAEAVIFDVDKTNGLVHLTKGQPG